MKVRLLAVSLLIALLISTNNLFAETLTLTTYYPAPSGSYKSMRSHNLCVGVTCVNGTVADNNLFVQGRVGVGTTAPAAILEVVGDIKIGNSTGGCTVANNGTIRYTGTVYEFCNGAAWGSLRGGLDCQGGSGMTVVAGQWGAESTCPLGYLVTGLEMVDIVGAPSGAYVNDFRCGTNPLSGAVTNGCAVWCTGAACNYKARCCRVN